MFGRRGALSGTLLLFFLVAGCPGDAGLTLVLEVRTDLRPGEEFSTVHARVDEAVPIVLPAVAGEDWSVVSRRVAEVGGLAPGARDVRLELRDDAGGVVVARTLSFDMDDDLGMTVVMSRDCAGRECPTEGGVALTCHGGRCVPPECTPITEAPCGVPACAVDDDCPPDACGSTLCADGVCLVPGSSCAGDGGSDGSMDGRVPIDSGVADVGPPDGSPDATAMDGATDASADADAGPPAECAPAPALIACYAFEGDLRDGVSSLDLTGDVTYGAGRFGMAMTVRSSSPMIEDEARLGPTSVTYEAWVRATTLPTGGESAEIISRQGAYGLTVYEGGDVECSFVTEGSMQIAFGPGLTRGDWIHLACTIEPTRGAQLWVDGAEVAWTPSGGLALGSTFRIGGVAGTSTTPFDGAIDRVRVWSRALTPAEIRAAAGR